VKFIALRELSICRSRVSPSRFRVSLMCLVAGLHVDSDLKRHVRGFSRADATRSRRKI